MRQRRARRRQKLAQELAAKSKAAAEALSQQAQDQPEEAAVLPEARAPEERADASAAETVSQEVRSQPEEAKAPPEARARAERAEPAAEASTPSQGVEDAGPDTEAAAEDRGSAPQEAPVTPPKARPARGKPKRRVAASAKAGTAETPAAELEATATSEPNAAPPLAGADAVSAMDDVSLALAMRGVIDPPPQPTAAKPSTAGGQVGKAKRKGPVVLAPKRRMQPTARLHGADAIYWLMALAAPALLAVELLSIHTAPSIADLTAPFTDIVSTSNPGDG